MPRRLFLLKLILRALRALSLSRRALVLENLALRQQLATLAQAGRRPRLVSADRLFWVALRQLWPDWSAVLAIVQPATVVAWHRRAFRVYWRRVSRTQGRQPIDAKMRELIGRMGLADPYRAIGRGVCPRPSPTAEIASLPRIGGLHHRYEWADAA